MVWKRVVCASVGLVSVTDELARCEGGEGRGSSGGRGMGRRGEKCLFVFAGPYL